MATDTPVWGHGRWGHFAYPDNPPTTFYRIDGQAVEELVAERRTWQTLELTFRVDEGTLTDRLAYLRDTAEKFETVTNADGSFRTLDRSDSGGVVEVQPPGTRTPPREAGEYVVASYSQQRLEQVDGGHEVTVAFADRKNREPDGSSVSETRASDEWGLQFRSGEIATKQVQYDFQKGTDRAAGTVDLQLVLGAGQTKVVEESVSRLAATSVREVPDGQNTIDDNSPFEKNSVVVTTPDDKDPLPDGKYAVSDWATSWLSTRGYRVTLTISPTDLARSGYGWGQWGGYQYDQL